MSSETPDNIAHAVKRLVDPDETTDARDRLGRAPTIVPDGSVRIPSADSERPIIAQSFRTTSGP
jgi:hypothetical protein